MGDRPSQPGSGMAKIVLCPNRRSFDRNARQFGDLVGEALNDRLGSLHSSSES